MQGLLKQLSDLKIQVRKLLCGRSQYLRMPKGKLYTRSVMIAELSKEDSVALQQKGLSTQRQMGCGLFVAHKGIAPVNSTKDE